MVHSVTSEESVGMRHHRRSGDGLREVKSFARSSRRIQDSLTGRIGRAGNTVQIMRGLASDPSATDSDPEVPDFGKSGGFTTAELL